MSECMASPRIAHARLALVVACVATSPAIAHASRAQQLAPAQRTAVAGTARTDAAESGDAPAARRQVRIAHLVARWDSLSRAADRAEQRRYAIATSDTIDAGIFRIRTTPALRRRVVRAALDVSRELQFSLDAQSLKVIRDGDLSVVTLLDDGSPWHRQALFVEASRDKAYCCEIPAVSWLRPDPLPQALRDLAVNLVSESFDGALREWLLQSSLPVLSWSAREESEARVEVGTAESEQARACLSGADRACSILLDLHGHPEDPLLAWYSREDYRALVARLRLAPTDPREAPEEQRACLAGATAACETLVRSLDGRRIPSPTLQAPRLSLLHHALTLGGPGALHRLRSTPGDVGARLAAASELDEAHLIQSWRTTMTDRTRASVRPTVPIAMASACWMMVVAGLGLRRTKRCR